MTGTVIFLRDHRSPANQSPDVRSELGNELSVIALELWRRRDELLAIIEGLRRPELAPHTRFGPVVASSQLTAAQALVEVELLIRQAERYGVSVI